MHLLTLDTSQGMTSLALWRGEECIDSRHHGTAGTQAVALIPQIQEMLSAAALPFTMLEGIGCATGPGGFTSVRIGVATARGLGFAARLPVWGVSIPEIMAWHAHRHAGLRGKLACVLPAGNRDFCVAEYDIDAAMPIALTPLTLVARENAAFALPISAPETLPLSGSIAFPIAKGALLLGELLLHVPYRTCYLSPVPLYAKPADAIAAPPLLSS